MQPLLNRLFRCIYDDSEGDLSVSFTWKTYNIHEWKEMLLRLEARQQRYPQRNYRLQICDANNGWLDFPFTPSKYALFSED